MATAESVINKINGLIATANAKTGRSDVELTSAVNALVDGYGQGGGGIIDVTELPTEGIDENAVYRVTNIGASFWLVMDGTHMTLEDWAANTLGVSTTFEGTVVDELPPVSEMKLPDLATFTYYVYVESVSGIGYINADGSMAVSLAEGIFQEPIDKGWTENIESETEMGVYTIRSQTTRRYIHSNGKWNEIVPKGNELEFALSADGTHYIVSAGIELPMIVDIPSEYNGLPVTEIAPHGFANRMSLWQVHIPDTVTVIGEEAFSHCFALMDIVGASSIKSIPYNAFAYCYSLFALGSYSPTWQLEEIGDYAFQYCKAMAECPFGDSLVSIGDGAFRHCTALKERIGDSMSIFEIPKNVKEIGYRAFEVALATSIVKFNGTPNNINFETFFNSYPITDIYVPWAEGAVGGAPWGATTATIHYNSDTENM